MALRRPWWLNDYYKKDIVQLFWTCSKTEFEPLQLLQNDKEQLCMFWDILVISLQMLFANIFVSVLAQSNTTFRCSFKTH